jgi:hypothetical protein
MVQMWSSKCVAKQVFVCETKEHAARLVPLAEQYNVELVVRPPDMLHPVNDTGGLPIRWGVDHALAEARKTGEWYGLITTPFVVSPCRKPGLYDALHAAYIERVNNPDYQSTYPCIMAMAPNPQGWFWQNQGGDSPVKMVVGNTGVSYNTTPNSYYGLLQHFITATWAWLPMMDLTNTRAAIEGVGLYAAMPFDIQEWEDCHIDTEEEWARAEYEFGKHIGQGPDAIELYYNYRKGWAHE